MDLSLIYFYLASVCEILFHPYRVARKAKARHLYELKLLRDLVYILLILNSFSSLRPTKNNDNNKFSSLCHPGSNPTGICDRTGENICLKNATTATGQKLDQQKLLREIVNTLHYLFSPLKPTKDNENSKFSFVLHSGSHPTATSDRTGENSCFENATTSENTSPSYGRCKSIEEEENDRVSANARHQSDSDSITDEGAEGNEKETHLQGNRSSTFSSSNEGESCSSTTEDSVNNVSPEGRLKVPFNSWSRGKMLGRGSFGTVYEGISDDGFFFAVKEVSLVDQDSNAKVKQSICQLEQEIALLSQCEHKNIVRYFGTDKESNKLYIFLELVTQGSLASLYQKYNLIDSQVRAYTRQILTGLKYLHDKNVIHRDIKCANILVDAHGLIKLADFGLAKETSKMNELKSFQGSFYWMAPEVVDPEKSYSFSADIWSLGCTVIEMVSQKHPYPGLEGPQALWKIWHGEPPPFPDSLSRDAKDFVQQCLQVKPEDRPTANELLSHPFVKRLSSVDLHTALMTFERR